MGQQRGDAARADAFLCRVYQTWRTVRRHGVDCPLHYTSPNAPKKRDVLGTILLSVLAGHWRYAHMTTVRCDTVNSAAPGDD
jgi:hypothetical protein